MATHASDRAKTGRAVLAVLAAVASASAAWAQPSAAPAAAAAPEADHARMEDRVFALVQAKRCGQARAEAERGGDAALAEQIAQMCGLTPGAPSPSSAGAGRGRDGGGGQGGSGSGRRGGP